MGSVWDRCGLVMESLIGNRFGIVWHRLYPFRIVLEVLGSVWDRFDVVYGRLLNRFGFLFDVDVRSVRDRFAIVLGSAVDLIGLGLLGSF